MLHLTAMRWLQIGHSRRYPKDKNRNFKIFLQFLNSLSHNELPLLYPLSAVRYTLFFCTKRAGSPLYRET